MRESAYHIDQDNSRSPISIPKPPRRFSRAITVDTDKIFIVNGRREKSRWESIKSIWRQGLDSGNVAVVLQVNAKPHPELAKVPNAVDFAPTENAKLLLKFGGHDPVAITRPYALGPGTPKDRVELLRKTFVETLKDPDFIADAKKSRLDTDPLTGEEIEKNRLAIIQDGRDSDQPAARDTEIIRLMCCGVAIK